MAWRTALSYFPPHNFQLSGCQRVVKIRNGYLWYLKRLHERTVRLAAESFGDCAPNRGHSFPCGLIVQMTVPLRR